MSRLAEARRLGHPARWRCGPAGGIANRLAREGPAATGEVRRWPVVSGLPDLDAVTGYGRAAGLDVSGRRWRCLGRLGIRKSLREGAYM